MKTLRETGDYWEIKVWGERGLNSWECGGHWHREPDETAVAVLARFFTSRSINVDEVTSTEVYLRQSGEAGGRP